MSTDADLDDITAYAKRLGVPRTWVRDAVTARRLQFTKVGRHVRFSQADHEANLAGWRQPAINGPAPARRPA